MQHTQSARKSETLQHIKAGYELSLLLDLILTNDQMLHFEWIMNNFPVQIESDFSNHQHSAKAWDEFFCTFGLQFNPCFVSFWKFRNWLLMHVLEKSREVWLPSTIQAKAAHIFIRIKYANPKNFNLGLFRIWVSSNARFSSWHSRVIDGPKTYSFYDSFQWINAFSHHRTHVSSSSKTMFQKDSDLIEKLAQRRKLSIQSNSHALLFSLKL